MPWRVCLNHIFRRSVGRSQLPALFFYNYTVWRRERKGEQNCFFGKNAVNSDSRLTPVCIIFGCIFVVFGHFLSFRRVTRENPQALYFQRLRVCMPGRIRTCDLQSRRQCPNEPGKQAITWLSAYADSSFDSRLTPGNHQQASPGGR